MALLAELGRHAGVTVNAVRLAQEAASHQRRLLAVREEERRRVGRELHDELGPTVAGLSMQLGLLRDLVRSDPQLVAGRLDALHASAVRALEDIRRVAHDLRPPVLDQLGLEGGLRQVAESLGLPASMDARTPALPAVVELAAYRIGAEALTNVARHAGASAVSVHLRVEEGWLDVSICDDGRGRDAVVGPGVGIPGMRERAEELGGHLVVGPGRDGGTLVRALLPITSVGSDLGETVS